MTILSALKDLLHELSGLDSQQLGEHVTFLEMGFDSLFLTRVNTAIQKRFDVKVSFRQLYDEAPTLSALAAYIDEQLPAAGLRQDPPDASLPRTKEDDATVPTGSSPSSGLS